MIVDFSKLETSTQDNMLGGEGTIYMERYMDDLGKIMVVTVHPGCSIGEHTHAANYEVCYGLKGSAKAIYDGVEERITPGVAHYCPKGHSHTVINDTNEDFQMYCVVAGPNLK